MHTKNILIALYLAEEQAELERGSLDSSAERLIKTFTLSSDFHELHNSTCIQFLDFGYQTCLQYEFFFSKIIELKLSTFYVVQIKFVCFIKLS